VGTPSARLMHATTWLMVGLGLAVEGIVISAAMRRWEARRPAVVLAALVVLITPSACFGLTSRGLNQKLTGSAGFVDGEWLRFGLTLSVVWALAIGVVMIPGRSIVERIVPLVLAGLLFTFGVTQVYAWEIADSNAYVTSSALPRLRAAGVDAPSELAYEAETGRPAIVTNSDWLERYNETAADHELARVVDPTDATRRQLLAAGLGFMAAAGVFTLASRMSAGDSTRRRVHLAAAALFAVFVLTAVPGSIGTTLPAIVTVAGLSLTLFELTKLVAIVAFALALRATAEGAPRGRAALVVVGLATFGLALTDLGAGITVAAIGLAMGTLVLRDRRSRILLIIAIAAVPVLAPVAAGALGDALPGAATTRIEDWTHPWDSHDTATVSNLALNTGQDIETAIAVRPTGVQWQRAVDLIEQELAFRVWATAVTSGEAVAPVIPVDTTDELLLAEAEQVWGELGGYSAATPEDRLRLVSRLDAVLVDLRSLDQATLVPRQDGFQLQRSLFALRAGGIVGVGLGQGRPEAIPTVTEDLALVMWGESAGLIGIITATGIVLALTTIALRRADRADIFASLLLIGLGSQYAIQAIVNAGGIIGALPFTGIPFPLLSRSGTAAVGAGVAIGLLMAVLDRQHAKQVPLVSGTTPQGVGLGMALGVVGASFAVLMVSGSRLLTPGPLFSSLEDIEARHLTVSDQWQNDDYRVARGPIVDRNGAVLIHTPELGGARGVADAALGRTASHVIRRLDDTLGAELSQRDAGASVGPTLVSTLDGPLQLAADAAFDVGTADVAQASGVEPKGAVVLLDARTGEILSMVSRPTFAPDELVDVSVWAQAEGFDRREGFDSRYVNRAIDGLYPPASTFKTITAAASLEAGHHEVGIEDFHYNEGESGPRDPGFGNLVRWHRLTIPDGPPVTGANHPHIEDWTFDIAEAFALSCNIAFAEMGIQLGADALVDAAQAFGFEVPITVEGLGTTVSTLDTEPGLPVAERPLAASFDALTRTSFGQGEVLASPLHMAMLAGAVANDGIMMTPRVVSGLQSHDGTWISQSTPSVFLDTGMSSETMTDLQTLFNAAVDYGTATNAAVDTGEGVGAKTGTGEWAGAGAEPHSWIIADYPANNPRLALAVIVEAGGAGGGAAARVASALLGSDEVAQYLRSVAAPQ
jgi:cell division protein FtsW (lipid II flippase)